MGPTIKCSHGAEAQGKNRMTPEDFVSKWKLATTKERAAAQEHFIDLCHLLGEPTPNEADPDGEWYAFEKGTTKTGAGRGWADVWKQGHFGWEYKGKGKDLAAALRQLQLYALALESPPLLVVSDMDTIEIHTAFTNAVQDVHVITLQELADPQKRQLLKWVFSEPERLRPQRTRIQITEEAAGKFAQLAFELRQKNHEPHVVAHFLNKILFCLFAEDAGLLPGDIFTNLVEDAVKQPKHADAILQQLFGAMKAGGPFGTKMIEWFNGGLFDDKTTLPLDLAQLRTLHELAKMDWSQMEPSIFGTLFERGLDPGKRSQLGAHYTDPGSIMRLVNPTVVEPLQAEWETVKQKINEHQLKAEQARKRAEQTLELATLSSDKEAAAKAQTAAKTAETRARNQIVQLYKDFLHRLEQFRVLDPACGSGNFLYLALRALKDLEHQVILQAESLGLERPFPSIGPEAVRGIEINSYAAELARVTVWIGEIQWMLAHGYDLNRNPILKPLDTIEEMDAVIGPDGNEPEWPAADVIVGNPPFLGDKKMLRELGAVYVDKLRTLYHGRVPGGADLVTYWFEKARSHLQAGKTRYVGLVATNSIRGGANRRVLENIKRSGEIFEAWSDEPWINEGAAVRVSLIAFGAKDHARPIQLNRQSVGEIFPDLTSSGIACGAKLGDLTQAKRLPENEGLSFMGITKSGPFDVSGVLAREWLLLPNVHRKPNCDVLFPSVNGQDIAKRSSNHWIIHFGDRSLEEASMYEAPFQYALEVVKPARQRSRTQKNREVWWKFERARPEMFAAFGDQARYIATCLVSKHRFFVFLDRAVVPENVVITVARADAVTFGILSSRMHELWALRKGTSLEDRPRYTPTTTFETFPFPLGVTPNLPPKDFSNPQARVVVETAKTLNELRENWLNPPEWTDRVPEVVPGYPERIIAKAGYEAELKKRTLTNLYNQRPAWLENAHRRLDEAVAAAYGWDDYAPDMSDEEILSRLLALNLSRAQ